MSDRTWYPGCAMGRLLSAPRQEWIKLINRKDIKTERTGNPKLMTVCVPLTSLMVTNSKQPKSNAWTWIYNYKQSCPQREDVTKHAFEPPKRSNVSLQSDTSHSHLTESHATENTPDTSAHEQSVPGPNLLPEAPHLSQQCEEIVQETKSFHTSVPVPPVQRHGTMLETYTVTVKRTIV